MTLETFFFFFLFFLFLFLEFWLWFLQNLHALATRDNTVFARPARFCCGFLGSYLICWGNWSFVTCCVVLRYIPPATTALLPKILYVVLLYSKKSLLSRLDLLRKRHDSDLGVHESGRVCVVGLPKLLST